MPRPAWLDDRMLNFERERANREARAQNMQGVLATGIQGLNVAGDAYKSYLAAEAAKRKAAEDAYYQRMEMLDRQKAQEDARNFRDTSFNYQKERDTLGDTLKWREGEAEKQRVTDQGAQRLKEIEAQGQWGVNKANALGEYGLKKEGVRGETALNVAGVNLEGKKYSADKGFEGKKYASDTQRGIAEMDASIKQEYNDRYLTNLENKTAAEIEQNKKELDFDIQNAHEELKLLERELDQDLRKNELSTQLKAMELKFKIDNAVWARENLTEYQSRSLDIGEQKADTGETNAETKRMEFKAKKPLYEAQLGKVEAETESLTGTTPIKQEGQKLANQAARDSQYATLSKRLIGNRDTTSGLGKLMLQAMNETRQDDAGLWEQAAISRFEELKAKMDNGVPGQVQQ